MTKLKYLHVTWKPASSATSLRRRSSVRHIEPLLHFVIFKGKVLLVLWFQEEDILGDWALTVSENGWTTNEISLDWLHYFDKATKQRTKGAKRLLILDGHNSHCSAEFEQFCQNKDIVTLCIPAHSSHILQPLDVCCFAPLKQAYSQQVEGFIRLNINHIAKHHFLSAFKNAYNVAITEKNIISAFENTGLVPFNPKVVLSVLDIRLRTPTPPLPTQVLWESKTPNNPIELQSQTEMLKDRIANHQNSSPTPIND